MDRVPRTVLVFQHVHSTPAGFILVPIEETIQRALAIAHQRRDVT